MQSKGWKHLLVLGAETLALILARAVDERRRLLGDPITDLGYDPISAAQSSLAELRQQHELELCTFGDIELRQDGRPVLRVELAAPREIRDVILTMIALDLNHLFDVINLGTLVRTRRWRRWLWDC